MSEQEFEFAYQTILPRLKRYAELLTTHSEAAKELVQQTALKVFTYRNKYDQSRASMITWAALIMLSEFKRPFRFGHHHHDKLSYHCVELSDSEYELPDNSCNQVEHDMDVAYWHKQIVEVSTPRFIEVSHMLHSGYSFAEIAAGTEQTTYQLERAYISERTRIRRRLGLFHLKSAGIRNSNKIITRNHLLPD